MKPNRILWRNKTDIRLMMAFIVATLAYIFTPIVEAATYKWVDSEGRTHLTDTPPPQGSFEVVPQQRTKAPDSGAQQRLDKMLESQKASRDARLTKKEERKKQLAEKKMRTEGCSRARKRLTVLNDRPARKIFTTDTDGSKRRLTEDERQTRLKKIKEQITDLCKK